MTPEQQRIAIATALGYINARVEDGHYRASIAMNPEGKFWGSRGIPDYLQDLNAMHEAEIYAMNHLLDSDGWEQYGKNLETFHPAACIWHPREEGIDYHDFATLMISTAAQRAEALLRTLNIWKP